ncbi:hypothetical protein ANO11243_084440 [Dothideomycetidae sp. 11243]|nr:hypothetical protein ANO11243_084440 [fungal sp. No.11243]
MRDRDMTVVVDRYGSTRERALRFSLAAGGRKALWRADGFDRGVLGHRWCQRGPTDWEAGSAVIRGRSPWNLLPASCLTAQSSAVSAHTPLRAGWEGGKGWASDGVQLATRMAFNVEGANTCDKRHTGPVIG